jgi:hypothetical protein
MRFRDMIRIRRARTAPEIPPRPGRPRRPRTHCLESLEGRELLSGLTSYGPPPEAANWSFALVKDLSKDADRTVFISQIAAATQDGPLAAIASPSTGFTPQDGPLAAIVSQSTVIKSGPAPAGGGGALLVAAREAVPGFSVTVANPADPGSFGGRSKGEMIAGVASQVEAQLGTSPGPGGFAAFLTAFASSSQGVIDLPSFIAFRDQLPFPFPFPGPIRYDLADSLPSRDANVDLDIVPGDPTTSAPIAVEPMGEGFGAPRGREDFATVPVTGPGMVPGLLGALAARGGLAPPVAPEPGRSLGLAGDDLPRDTSAQEGTAEAPDAMSAQDGAGVIDGAIADVEAALSRGADLLASFSPFDRVALEHTIDRFLGEVGELGAVFSNLEVTATLIPNLMAAAGAVVMFETVRRRVRGPSGEEVEDAEGDGDAGPPGLPGLPRGWALEEL